MLHCTRIFILSFTFALSIRPQTEEGALTGTIRDGQTRAIADATVEVRQEQTMLVRSVRTSRTGAWFLGSLPLGTYQVEVSRPGFAPVRFDAVRLSIGQTRTVDATLQVSGGAEAVTVYGKASELDQTTAATGGTIEQTQLRELPLNGRNWASFLTLIPGAVDPGGADQRSVRFAGHGRDDNNFTFDGVDASGISNQPQKSFLRLAIPTSAITEFKVDSTLFTVAEGSATGGQVILASAGGTNEFHGDVFEYFRNDVFDARNPFAPTNPPLRLNQFGASFGGPVLRNKTFFFLSFEGLRQRLDQTLQGFVPSASYRAQSALQTPGLRPLLDLYPTAGTLPQANDPTTDRFAGLSPQRDDENSGMVRLDHRFSSKTSAFLRVNVDEAVGDNPLGNLTDRQVQDARPLNGAVNITRIVSPSVLNESRLGFNQVLYRSSNLSGLPFTLNVAGFTSLSSSRTREEDDTSASAIDNVTWVHSRHIIKAGGEVRRVNTNPGSSIDGALTYASRNTFQLNQADSASLTAALPLKRLRKTQVFGFLEDEFRAAANLTITLGVRYSFFNVFHEADGRAVPFDLATCGGFCAPGAQFSAPHRRDIDPRVSFAWVPQILHGTTVIRSGAGIFHGDGQLEDQNLPASNDTARYSLNSRQVSGLAYPIAPFLANTPGILSPRAQDRLRKDEYSAQWGVSLRQQLPLNVIGTLGYFGNKGTNLQTITAANLADPSTGLRPNPQFGQVEYRTDDSNSTFHALQLSAMRTFRAGWLLGANYMWSHAINDGSLGGGEADAITPENPFCRACERASSAQDIRHFFTTTTVYELPFGAGKSYLSAPGFGRAVLGGWTLSGIGTARSGRPVNITISRSASDVPGGYNQTQRPDLIPGVSLIPPGGQTLARWINPAAFTIPPPGRFGNAGRNLARGPSFYQMDIALARHIGLTDRLSAELRAECFNILNRPQYGDPAGNLAVPAQFGLISSTINTGPTGTGTPRQLQFSAQLRF